MPAGELALVELSPGQPVGLADRGCEHFFLLLCRVQGTLGVDARTNAGARPFEVAVGLTCPLALQSELCGTLFGPPLIEEKSVDRVVVQLADVAVIGLFGCLAVLVEHVENLGVPLVRESIAELPGALGEVVLPVGILLLFPLAQVGVGLVVNAVTQVDLEPDGTQLLVGGGLRTGCRGANHGTSISVGLWFHISL